MTWLMILASPLAQGDKTKVRDSKPNPATYLNKPSRSPLPCEGRGDPYSRGLPMYSII
jgi:hypothetical protein